MYSNNFIINYDDYINYYRIYFWNISTVVFHIYAYDRAKTLSFILLIRRKSTEFENESNV